MAKVEQTRTVSASSPLCTRRQVLLDKVTDPELREVMAAVLDEDADLIAYLSGR